MKIRLLLDEDIHAGLAEVLRMRGFDAIHIQELYKKGALDDEVLLEAVKDQRTIFTFNLKDFVLLFDETSQKNIDHYGIIVSKQLGFNETLKRLLKLLQVTLLQKK